MNALTQAIPVAKAPINSRVIIPGSKSITNRALLLGSLAKGVSVLSGILISDDTLACIEGLRQLGIPIQLDKINHTCIIGGSSGRFPRNTGTIQCQEAATVGRFLLAAAASSSGYYSFDASLQLKKRPLAGLLALLRSQGAQTIPKDALSLPVIIQGMPGLLGGEITINTEETSQFVSAMMMVAPLAQSAVILNMKGNVVSHPYIDMTRAMMADFGVIVHKLHQSRYSILVPQQYKAQTYAIEPDLSTASYFFAAAAITGGGITIQSFSLQKTRQGDVQFIDLLVKMGCTVQESDQGFTLKGPIQLKGINADMRHFSDTFMTLAVLAPFATSPTTITNIAHTRHKESDRLNVMKEELSKLNITVEEGPDWLRIYPSTPKGGVVNTHADHRIAMAFSVMGLRVSNLFISGAECVTKTCPEFFKLLSKLTPI